MALLTPQAINSTGTTPVFVAATAGGDTLVNQSTDVFLWVKNGGAGTITVTIAAIKACEQGVMHNLVVSVPAGTDKVIGPIDQYHYNDNNNQAGVAYSGVTSVTVAAFLARG